MPKPREFLDIPQAIVHAYNRGIDQRQLFRRPRDYEGFLQMLMEAKEKTDVTIIVHTLMPTHFHCLLQQHEPYAIADFMQRACYAFSRWSNIIANRRGPLFDGPYGGKHIQAPETFLLVSRYGAL